jgi:hypothetical protein
MMLCSNDKVYLLVELFLTIQTLNKLYHWNTTSYARHKATDRFNEKFLALVDRFVEVLIGKDNVKPMIESIRINAKYLSDNGIKELFIFLRKYLTDISNSLDSTDLQNIKDEMLSEVNQTLYLFNLQ